MTKYHTNGYWVGSFHVASSPRRHLLARLAPGCDSNCSRKGLNDQDSMVRMVLLTRLLLLFGSLFTAVHSWGEKKQTHRKNICRKPVKGFFQVVVLKLIFKTLLAAICSIFVFKKCCVDCSYCSCSGNFCGQLMHVYWNMVSFAVARPDPTFMHLCPCVDKWPYLLEELCLTWQEANAKIVRR